MNMMLHHNEPVWVAIQLLQDYNIQHLACGCSAFLSGLACAMFTLHNNPKPLPALFSFSNLQFQSLSTNATLHHKQLGQMCRLHIISSKLHNNNRKVMACQVPAFSLFDLSL